MIYFNDKSHETGKGWFYWDGFANCASFAVLCLAMTADYIRMTNGSFKWSDYLVGVFKGRTLLHTPLIGRLPLEHLFPCLFIPLDTYIVGLRYSHKIMRIGVLDYIILSSM